MGQNSSARTEDALRRPTKQRKKADAQGGEVIAGRLQHLPESVTYTGTHVIELPIPPDMFAELPSGNGREELPLTDGEGKVLTPPATTEVVKAEIEAGFAGSKLFPGARDAATDVEAYPALKALLLERMAEIATMMQKRLRLNVYRAPGGDLTWNYLPEPSEARPRLLLVQTFQLTTHLGDYGPGRTLSTFTLLPGEETEITISTYRSSVDRSKRASSVFDSFDSSSASELQSEIQVEQGARSSVETSFEYNVSGQMQASWGWGSGSISAGVGGGVSTASEAFARSVCNAVDRHASITSSHRDVQINTSGETKTKQKWSEATKRTLRNPNRDLTLNFVFRQLNQEFITLLSLVDVRVAYFDGYGEHRREVELPALDDLLAEVICGQETDPGVCHGITVLPKKVNAVRSMVLAPLWRVLDYRDQQIPLIEEVSYEHDDGQYRSYVRVRKDLKSHYSYSPQALNGAAETPSTEGSTIRVPGIIVRATRNILRTDSVIVDCLLGAETAHGSLARKLTEVELHRQAGINELLELRSQRERQAQRIVREKDDDAAATFAAVFGSQADPLSIEEVNDEP